MVSVLGSHGKGNSLWCEMFGAFVWIGCCLLVCMFVMRSKMISRVRTAMWLLAPMIARARLLAPQMPTWIKLLDVTICRSFSAYSLCGGGDEVMQGDGIVRSYSTKRIEMRFLHPLTRCLPLRRCVCVYSVCVSAHLAQCLFAQCHSMGCLWNICNTVKHFARILISIWCFFFLRAARIRRYMALFLRHWNISRWCSNSWMGNVLLRNTFFYSIQFCFPHFYMCGFFCLS